MKTKVLLVSMIFFSNNISTLFSAERGEHRVFVCKQGVTPALLAKNKDDFEKVNLLIEQKLTLMLLQRLHQ